MSEVEKIRTVKIDDVKTSLYKHNNKFYTIKHDQENNSLFYKSIFNLLTAPALAVFIAFWINYSFVNYLYGSSYSLLNILVALLFGLFIAVQLFALAPALLDGCIFGFLGNLFSLLTPRSRFSLYVHWGNQKSITEYIKKRFRTGGLYESRGYYYGNDTLRESDSIVEYCTKVDDDELISFIQNCETSKQLLNKIIDTETTLKDSLIKDFIRKDLNTLLDSLYEELDQVDNLCKAFIKKADEEQSKNKAAASNSKALKLLAS